MKAVYLIIGVAEQSEATNNQEMTSPALLEPVRVFQPSVAVLKALTVALATRFPIGAKSDDEAIQISGWLNNCLNIVRSNR